MQPLIGPGGGVGPALAALSSRYGLAPAQRAQLATVLASLARERRAPTTVRDPALAVDVHVADSLVALELERVRSARTVADLGSGPGFPGLPLAVALAADVRLLESQARKSAFLEDLIADAGVENARVVNVRAEEWREGFDGHDLVVARALAPQPVVLEYAAPLLRVGGALVDWRAGRSADDEQAALSAALTLGMLRSEVRRVAPFAGARDRHLHVYLKVSPTPGGFPRRAGIARKRPLGRSTPLK